MPHLMIGDVAAEHWWNPFSEATDPRRLPVAVK
jgi:hypothetical protein